MEAGASLRVETFERRRILELATEAKSFGTLELLLRRHEIALLEKPPYFLFTRRTSGKALQFALEKNMFSRGVNIQGVDILFRHFEKAKEYQRKHLQGRSAELRQIWNQGLETTPEDEEPYELGWQEATGAEGENARQKLQELESRLNTAYATEQALKGALFGKRQSDERCPKRPEIFPCASYNFPRFKQQFFLRRTIHFLSQGHEPLTRPQRSHDWHFHHLNRTWCAFSSQALA